MNKVKRKNVIIPSNVFFVRPGARYFITRNPFSLLHEWRTGWEYIVILSLGLIFMLLSVPTLHREVRLLTEATTTSSAEIMDREARTCRRKNSSYTCYYVTYRYFQGDRRYTGTRRDDHQSVGQSYTVTYLDSNPRVHHVGGKTLVMDDMAWILGMGLFFVVIAIYACADVWMKYRPYELDGEWAYGELSSVKGERIKRGKNSEYKLSVRYQYTNPFSLAKDFGGQVETRNDLNDGRLPEKGRPVLLLVRPNGDARAL